MYVFDELQMCVWCLCVFVWLFFFFLFGGKSFTAYLNIMQDRIKKIFLNAYKTNYNVKPKVVCLFTFLKIPIHYLIDIKVLAL